MKSINGQVRVLPSVLCRTMLVFVALVLMSITFSWASSYELGFATYMGGSQWERVQSVFVDAGGHIYIAGTTKSTDFFVTSGAYDTAGTGGGVSDGFVAKLAPDGTKVIWSTYLHGSDRDDVYGILADNNGYVYVTGWTRSSNFPTTAGVYDRIHNGQMDVFITKIAPDGSSLVYSTFFGGSGTDQCRGGMFIDDSGCIYLSGYTDSTNFPITSGAIQSTFRGGYGDAFIAKLSADGSSVLFSTYLGSSGPDHAFPGICVHSDGSIIVTGAAGAADFPTTANAYQSDFGGSHGSGVWYGDAFVARFSLTPTYEHTLHYITFLGGSGDEKSTAQHGLVVDENGNAILAGTTLSTDFPTTSGAFQANLNGENNIYISKLSPDGKNLIASTYFGGTTDGGYEPSGISVYSSDYLVVSGSIFGNVVGHPVTSDAFQQTSGGANEAFFAVLSPDFTALKYSSFFGGAGDDRIRDLWQDPCGGIVFGGDTYSTNLPTSDDVFQDSYVGNGDSYVAKFNLLVRDVDFSGDGKVNFEDYSKLAQYWSQDESTVDIAPPPFGDYMVDFKDVGVFVESWLTATTIPPLPSPAGNPNPPDGAVYVSTTADLSWTAGSDATSHDVYFGTSSLPPFIRNQTAVTFDPGTMAMGTKYYWRIDAVNGWGTTVGQVWDFITMTPPPP
jgi:hypothetical protein